MSWEYPQGRFQTTRREAMSETAANPEKQKTPEQTGKAQASPETKPVRRLRRVNKKAKINLPKLPPVPVRALWQAATDEQRQQAHQTGVAILEWWLGHADRHEVAERLEIPPLRLWQLSQQALSGMVAGLLKQPKSRGKEAARRALDPQEDPKLLKKRITELKDQLRRCEALIRLLRDLPAHRVDQKEGGESTGKRKRTTKRKGAKKKAPSLGDPQGSGSLGARKPTVDEKAS